MKHIDNSSASRSVDRSQEEKFLYKWVSRTLLASLMVSLALMLTGSLLLVLAGRPLPSEVLSFGQIFEGLLGLDPAAILNLGILLLLSTPILSIIISLSTFLRHRDWLYVAASATVLFILSIAILIAAT